MTLNTRARTRAEKKAGSTPASATNSLHPCNKTALNPSVQRALVPGKLSPSSLCVPKNATKGSRGPRASVQAGECDKGIRAAYREQQSYALGNGKVISQTTKRNKKEDIMGAQRGGKVSNNGPQKTPQRVEHHRKHHVTVTLSLRRKLCHSEAGGDATSEEGRGSRR